MILMPHAHKQATSNTAVSHLGTFGLYPDGFTLQRAPAGPSRPQQVLRHTPEPLYVTLGSSVAEGLRATSNIGTHDGWVPNERYGESKALNANLKAYASNLRTRT